MSPAALSPHDSAPVVRAGRRVARALVIAPTPFFGDRGCHVRIFEEVRALARLGVASEIVTYPFGQDVPGLQITRCARVPGLSVSEVGPSYSRPAFDLSLVAAALKAARRFRPDVVHAHLHEGICVGAVVRARLGVPLIADLQGSLAAELVDHRFIGSSGPLVSMVRRAERWLVQRPDAVLASSRETISLLESQGVEPQRVHYLPDGVDLEQFKPTIADEQLRDRLGLKGKQVVVFLGLLTAYQGVDLLIQAVPEVTRLVPDVHFLIMGYPNDVEYRRRVHDLGLAPHVTVTGRIPYDMATRYLALGDIAVSPKHSLTEANGKLLNYMACGLPTIATDTPVNRDLLGEAGVYVPLHDPAALALGIADLLRDRVKRTTLGLRLRERAEAHFAWPALANSLLHVYERVGGPNNQ